MKWLIGVFVLPLCFWGLVFWGLVNGQAAAEEVSFNRDIRPLLADRCFACHGPNAEKREALLRLDVATGELSPFHARDGYQVIKPGDPDSSEIWKRLTTEDPSLQMPPGESGKKPFTDAQKQLVRQWILQGAPYEEFWAFTPPRPQKPPTVSVADPLDSDTSWIANRLDQFVLASLEKKQHKPQPRADRRTLIRRVTLDLTGLPPTREEIHAFENDDRPDAYVKVVDRLLSLPRYGEHMARYWLDLVRFADTNGMHHDHYRELTPYRDWVIRSYNANMPFDEFVTYQLAGDLLPSATPEQQLDQQIASGYNRLHMVMDKGTNPPQESYTRNTVDQVVAFGTVFLGLTLECSVCHDHKYDPVRQRDFYQLFAFFNNIDGDPETPGREQQAPLLRLPTEEQDRQVKEVEQKLSAVTSEIDSLNKSIGELKSETPTNSETEKAAASERSSELARQLKEKEEELARWKAAKGELDRAIPLTLVMKERSDVQPAYILKRGAYDQPGEEVSRNTPAFLPPLEAGAELKTRLDLARWLTDKRNPLMARVTVNRLWQQLFGVGLVKTSEDFGSQGEFPSHPELLDDLANAFVDTQWNVKSLVRSILLSQTYQQSSRGTPAEFRADPENRLLARGSRVRLDAEVIRDSLLHISGLLNSAMYGRSVKPPQPTDLWKTVSMVSSSTYSFKADSGDKIYRRSFYTFWKRAMPPPQMSIFDAPTRETCTSRRERTNTPVQALMMMNESQYFEAARHFAQQLLAYRSPLPAAGRGAGGEGDQTDEQRLRVAYESVTSHLPEPAELAALENGLDSCRAVYRDDMAAAKALTADFVEMTDAQRIELAAYTMVINAIFNLDVAKTRE